MANTNNSNPNNPASFEGIKGPTSTNVRDNFYTIGATGPQGPVYLNIVKKTALQTQISSLKNQIDTLLELTKTDPSLNYQGQITVLQTQLTEFENQLKAVQ
jgi:hypothetical protein